MFRRLKQWLCKHNWDFENIKILNPLTLKDFEPQITICTKCEKWYPYQTLNKQMYDDRELKKD